METATKMCPSDQKSEMHDKYKLPKLKRQTVTRAKRFEQFLWQELYNEYLRYNERLKAVPETAFTEYYLKYCRDLPPENLVAKEQLINRYPLYSTRAITVWNQKGDVTKDFKKRYAITRPVHEQLEQFG